jgi:hypothetical protein
MSAVPAMIAIPPVIVEKIPISTGMSPLSTDLEDAGTVKESRVEYGYSTLHGIMTKETASRVPFKNARMPQPSIPHPFHPPCRATTMPFLSLCPENDTSVYTAVLGGRPASRWFSTSSRVMASPPEASSGLTDEDSVSCASFTFPRRASTEAIPCEMRWLTSPIVH